MDKKIFFTDKEIGRALAFTKSINWKHSQASFSDISNKSTRSSMDAYLSVLRGKLAEIALQKYLQEKHKGKHEISPLDFNIYKKGVCDSFDLGFDKYKISIKSSKIQSSCLLVEKDKYKTDVYGNPISIDGHSNMIPDFYAFVKVKIDMNDIKDSYAYICGAISHKDFWRKKKELPRGTYINKKNMDELFKENKPLSQLTEKKGVELLASNYGLHIDLLKPF